MTPIILSGGSGERLWPYSRPTNPKQYGLFMHKSLLETTMIRFKSLKQSPIIITNINQKNIIKNSAYLNGVECLYEPKSRNTAPAIALLCRYFELHNKAEEVVGVFAADHLIEDEKAFFNALNFAEDEARADKIVTLGVQPTFAATGYGYIETLASSSNNQVCEVSSFKEKPSLLVAEKYLQQGNYFWNAGIFIFKISTMIAELKKYKPEMWACFNDLNADLSNLEQIYDQVEKISIDHAILEHSEILSCVPVDMGWKDLGSWDEMAKLNEESSDKVLDSESIIETYEAEGNFSFSKQKKLHAFVGVNNLIVIDTPDALLIAEKGSTQKVKEITQQLKAKSFKDIQNNECRPWGRYESLVEQSNFKFKKITVLPGERLSYQSHESRSEHWIVLSGTAEFTLNDEVSRIKQGDHVFIPKTAKHRIKNVGMKDLVFVEVQVGDYFGEDDIVRYSDDYGRSESLTANDSIKKAG